jgi:hypothetical protein
MFLPKPVRHGSLTLPFEPFRFWIKILGVIRNQKATQHIVVAKASVVYSRPVQVQLRPL